MNVNEQTILDLVGKNRIFIIFSVVIVCMCKKNIKKFPPSPIFSNFLKFIPLLNSICQNQLSSTMADGSVNFVNSIYCSKKFCIAINNNMFTVAYAVLEILMISCIHMQFKMWQFHWKTFTASQEFFSYFLLILLNIIECVQFVSSFWIKYIQSHQKNIVKNMKNLLRSS